MIRKTKGGYLVLSRSGKRLGGPYKSKQQAQKRLKQVEYHAHKKEDMDAFGIPQLIERGMGSLMLKNRAKNYRKLQGFEEAVDEFGVPQALENAPMFDVEAGKKEIQDKSEMQIEMETAINWASRSAASYEMVLSEPDLRSKIERIRNADDFYNEALEHAGSVADNGLFLSKLQPELDQYKKRASAHLEEMTKAQN
jgi:hypothetical protein